LREWNIFFKIKNLFFFFFKNCFSLYSEPIIFLQKLLGAIIFSSKIVLLFKMISSTGGIGGGAGGDRD